MQAGYKAGDDVYHRARRRVQRAVERRRQDATSSRSRGTGPARADEMVKLYEDWVRQYPIISIEDGLAEGDWDGWKTLTTALGDRVQLVGDDVFVTNPEILQARHQRESRQRDPGEAESDRHGHRDARRRRAWRATPATPASSRIGQVRPKTRRSPISPSRTNAGQIKTGSASRTDRVAKYNQLLRIEEELGIAGDGTPARAGRFASAGEPR